jgi:hypothetical protein
MSITEMAAGRMRAEARSFGARRTPPAIATPQPLRPIEWSLAWAWRIQVKSRLAAEARILTLALRPRSKEACVRDAAIRKILHSSDVNAIYVRVFAYLGALAVLAVGMAEMLRAPVAAGIESAPRAEWIDVANPFPAFSLPLSDLAGSGYRYGMQRHATGGGRRDIMRWGELQGEAPHLAVEVYRPAAEFTHFDQAQREIAARTDAIVSAAAVEPAGTMDSKFGPFALVKFTLGQQPLRQCLGFTRAFEHPRLQIVGRYCTQGRELINRDLVGCALDRLTLLAAGSDAAVGELFARAELKRNFCGQPGPLFAATPKLGPSAIFGPETRLRGRLAAP